MNTVDIKEDIDVGINSISVDIPVRVSMLSVMNAPFDFTASIDDAGQIILTPTSKEMEFTSANTESNVEFEKPIMDMETVFYDFPTGSEKETSIKLTANILTELDNVSISADVDEIGQCVIYPQDKNSQFISVSVDDSLNLVTEEAEKVEQTEETETEESRKDQSAETVPDVTAEAVINEEQEDAKTEERLAFEAALEAAKKDKKGTLKVSSDAEAQEALDALSKIFDNVSIEYSVSYSNDTKLTEDLSETERFDVISRFMRGEVPLFSDNGKPQIHYTHLDELDSNGYSYYYDAETDCIISYAE